MAEETIRMWLIKYIGLGFGCSSFYYEHHVTMENEYKYTADKLVFSAITASQAEHIYSFQNQLF